jgi:hypothetical protein
MKTEIELFRIISIFGIVWFHTGIALGRDVAYGGLIFFIIISVYFATKSNHKHGVIRRAERLIIPCVVWSIFYGTISFVKAGHIFPENYSYFSMIFATPSIHLWFLPFIFLILLAIDNLRFLLSREWFGMLVGISALLTITLAPIWREFSYVPPLGQYAHAMPAVLIGIFLGVYENIRFKLRSTIMVGIVLSILFMVYQNQSGIGIPYAVGLIPCVFLFYENVLIKSSQFILWLASATFGVYLSHVFVLLVMSYIGITGYMLPIITFILAILAILIVRFYVPKNLVKYVT